MEFSPKLIISWFQGDGGLILWPFSHPHLHPVLTSQVYNWEGYIKQQTQCSHCIPSLWSKNLQYSKKKKNSLCGNNLLLKIVNQNQEELQRLVPSSKKYKSGCPHHTSEQFTYFTLEEIRWIWKMITDYPKFNKVLVSVAGAMPDIPSFLGYISTASHTWFI